MALLDLSQFITPITPVGAGSRGSHIADSIGDLGEYLSKLHQQAIENDLAQQKINREGAAQQALAGYYNSQAALGQGQLAETKRQHDLQDEERNRKDMNALVGEYTKALRGGDMGTAQQIRQRISALGGTVEEADTAMPPEQVSTPGLAVKSSSYEPVKLTKEEVPGPQRRTKPVNRDLLTGIAASAQGPVTPQEPGPGIDEIAKMSGNLDSLMGIPSAQPQAGPQTPARGGKFTIKDRKGNIVSVYDQPLEQNRMRMGIQGALGALADQDTPEGKAAAERSLKFAQGLVGQGYTEKEAIDAATAQFDKEMGQYRKRLAPGAGGGGGSGFDKAQAQAMHAMNEETRHWFDSIGTKMKTADAETARQNADTALTMLSHGDEGGMLEHGALKQYLYGISGKVVTDGEMNRLLNSAGKFTSWEAAVDQYTNEGHMPEEFKRQLGQLLSIASERAKGILSEAGEKGYQVVLHATGDENQANIIRGAFTGDFGQAPTPAAPRLGKPKAKGAPAPQGGMTPEQKRAKLLEMVK